MNQDAKEQATGEWTMATIVGFFVATILLVACGCCSITVRTSGNGSVSVHQTRVVSTDATIPASVIP